MDTTITVYIITLAVLHLNPTLAVLYLNPTFEVLRLNLTFTSLVEEIEELQTPVTQKKPTQRRQTAPKKRPQKEKAVDQRCIPWTPEEETTLCKGWVRTSEYSVKGNMRKEMGFWIDILKYMHDTCPITQRRTYDMVNGKWKTVRPKVLLFVNNDELLALRQKRKYGKNKRYKSSGSSSFITKDSGEGSINLNTLVGSKDENEVEEVEEVHRPRPMGRDQANRKMKASYGSAHIKESPSRPISL
nr:hypothetical protein [Tanacetum cinerariifolium]